MDELQTALTGRTWTDAIGITWTVLGRDGDGWLVRHSSGVRQNVSHELLMASLPNLRSIWS